MITPASEETEILIAHGQKVYVGVVVYDEDGTTIEVYHYARSSEIKISG